VQYFMQIRPLGTSRQIGEIYNNCFFLFPRRLQLSQTGQRIFTRDGSNDAVSRKGAFLKVKNSKSIFNPSKIPSKLKIGPKNRL